MYYYKYNDNILISYKDKYPYEKVSECSAAECNGILYVLISLEAGKSKRCFAVNHTNLLSIDKESIHMLLEKPEGKHYPEWLRKKISEGKVCAVNTDYSNWESILDWKLPQRWKINICGLGDVGGILLSGLRLLGGNEISEIGIYDMDKNKIMRWEYEANQILSTSSDYKFPKVKAVEEEELFNCDMFVFCVSVGVPPVGDNSKDIRLAQFEGNRKIINYYARSARENGFKGIFAVVSDPVDLLCKAAWLESNKNECGKIDFKGLMPEQIRGYGLGVMHARAAYFAENLLNASYYTNEGRAFGPHGEGLIIADSIENYNEEISLKLTDLTKNANLMVRETGYKPYIAPALSSGTLSLLATIRGEWHYSAVFINGVYMGWRNRFTMCGTELEILNLPDNLFKSIYNTYEKLGNMI